MRLDFDSITLMPRSRATTGAFTMFTRSVIDSSRPFSTAIVIGATRSSATPPAYSISISSIWPGQSWPYSFSPDGTKIAFAGLRDGVWNVGWVARDGDTEQMVTRNGRLTAYVRYPAWAPTGDAIFYELAETTGNIWLLERSASADGRGRDGGRP